jgi:hypothetical protein
MTIEDGILDPAHDDDTNVEHAGAAGLAKPDENPDDAKADELKVSEDGNVAEHKGVKYVRQEALHNERKERQRLAQTLAELDPVMPEFEAFLQQRNNRQQATVERTRESVGRQSDYSVDELEGFAVTRGYYKDDNTTPDLNRAARELDILSGISRRQAASAVRPVAEQSIRERANLARERARGSKFVDGQPVAEDKYMEAAISTLGDEHMADPNVANLVQVIAAGLQHLDQRKNGTAGRTHTSSSGHREPMFVEGGSGRFDGNDGEMSALDVAAARARGKSPEQWAKLSKQVNASKKNSAVLDEA